MQKQHSIMTALLFLFGLFIAPAVTAQDYQFERLAKAEPDECYTGFGKPYHDINNCPDGGIPKRNHTYGWSLAMSENDIWIGTGANSGTIFTSGIVGQENLVVKEIPGVYAIEGRHSKYPGVPYLLRPYLGDWRPPQIWVYDNIAKTQTNITPDDPLIEHTLGFRAAAEVDGMIIFAGASRINLGTNMFVFDVKTRAFLGSHFFPEYCGVRKFVIVNNILYTSLLETSLKAKGVVLRWTGNRNNPFQFKIVGKTDGMGANMVEHNGRIYIGTWPFSIQGSILAVTSIDVPEAGIWMSPIVPKEGLTDADIDKWKKVWKASDYEPDPIIAPIYGTSSMASYGEYLYWGTMHQIGSSVLAICRDNNGCPDNATRTMRYALRHPAVFRCNDFDKEKNTPSVELLYGEKQLYVCTLSKNKEPEQWSLADNNMGGIEPLYGPAGFGTDITYIWSVAVHDNKLFIGTDGTEIESGLLSINASLWCFNDTHSAAELINKNGLDNRYNGGLRNMRSTEGGLIIETLNHANLSPEGGWELIRMIPKK